MKDLSAYSEEAKDESRTVHPLCGWLVLVALTLAGGTLGDDQPTAPPADLSPDAVRVHLHVHALSNHNGANAPASVEWQVAQASDLPGDDYIWITEHSEIFTLPPATVLSFRGFENRPKERSLVFRSRAGSPPKGMRKVHRTWRYEATEGVSIALEDSVLKVRIPPGTPDSPRTFQLSPGSGEGRIHSIDFSRPVATGLRIELKLGDTNIPEGSSFSVVCSLSAHSALRDRLPVVRFRVIGDGGGEERGPRVEETDPWTVDEVVPLPGAGDNLSLDVAGAAALLPDGRDNTLVAVLIRASNQVDQEMQFSLDGLTLRSRVTDPDSLKSLVLSLMNTYEDRCGVGQSFGGEFRFAPLSCHMTTYLAAPIPTAWLRHRYGAWQSEWVERVEHEGGIAALCHALGTNGRIDPTAEARFRRREESFQSLRREACYGAQLLEVGYPRRGYGVLEDYLLLWDGLTASGVALTGIGVTDSHGGVWRECVNSWATWVYGPARPDSILKGLTAGRCYAGDGVRWDGQLDLRVGSWAMGDRVPDLPGSTSVFVALSPAGPDLQTCLTVFRLGQILAVLADMTYEVESRSVEPNRWHPMVITEPSAIRASVRRVNRDGSSEIVALGNPILFLGGGGP